MGSMLSMQVVPLTFVLRELEWHEVGFDYAQTVRELNQHFTYEQIAGFCGYQSRQSVMNLLNPNVTPAHPQGEALYIMYVERFGRKPPRKAKQTGQPAPV